VSAWVHSRPFPIDSVGAPSKIVRITNARSIIELSPFGQIKSENTDSDQSEWDCADGHITGGFHGCHHLDFAFGHLALDRRTLVKGALASGAALAATPVLAPAVHAAKTLKLGYVSPRARPSAAALTAE
jgi:hypothetical protein